MKSQEIKLKSEDLKKALVRGLSRRLYETKKSGRSTKELVHLKAKFKKEKHKNRFSDFNE